MNDTQILRARELNRKAESTPLISNCCGKMIIEDTDLCSCCGEHCSKVEDDFSWKELWNDTPLSGKLLIGFIALGMIACVGAQIASKLYSHFNPLQ